MLKPGKSLAYFYGADKNIPLDKSDHDCSKCNQTNCKYKNKDVVHIVLLLDDGKS